jgi:hypothetical protein
VQVRTGRCLRDLRSLDSSSLTVVPSGPHYV